MILTHLFESLNEARLNVGDPIIVTGPNEFEGKTGEIAEFSPSGKFVVVNLYNHGEHSMHLSDVEFNQYAADQEDEDDWYDDGAEDTLEGATDHAKQIHDLNFDMLALLDAAKTASPEQKAILKQKFQIAKQKRNELLGGTLADSPKGDLDEGFVPLDKYSPTAVCLAGKPVKKFDYYKDAENFYKNWKQKLYREGNKEKADTITLMPLNLDEAAPRHFGPKGAGTELARQIRANGDTNWVNDLSKDQLNALAGPRYPKRPKIQVKKNQVKEFAPSPERDEDEVPDQILKLANRWWNATDDQPKITNVLRSLGWSIAQVESEDDAVQLQHNDGTTVFISADDFDPEVFEQGVAEGDELTHAGQDVMVWTGPPTNNPPRDDKKYWVRGQLDSTEMHGGSMRANVMTAKGMYNPELSRVFNADMSEAYTPSPAKPFRNPRGFNKQGTGVGNKLAQQTRAELAKKKQPVKEFAPSNGDNRDNFDPEMAAMAKKEGVVKGYSLVDHATVEQALEIPHCQWGDMYDGQYKQYFVKGFINGRKAKLEQARKDGVALTLQKDGRLARVQQGVAEDTDSWFRVTVKTPNGKNRNIQVPANSHGTAKRKALAYCAKNGIAGAEFVSAMRMPTLDEQGVAEGEGIDPKIQFLQPTIQFAEKMGYRVTLNPQGRVVAKLVNKQLGHIVHIGLMQPSSKGFEVSMADNLGKQTNAWSAKELAQDFKGWYAQAVKDQDFNNGYNEKPQLEQQGVAEGIVDTIRSKNYARLADRSADKRATALDNFDEPEHQKQTDIMKQRNLKSRLLNKKGVAESDSGDYDYPYTMSARDKGRYDAMTGREYNNPYSAFGTEEDHNNAIEYSAAYDSSNEQGVAESATAPIIVPKRRAKAKPEPKFDIPYSASDYVPPALAMASAEALDRIIADPSTKETTRELAKKARAKKQGVSEEENQEYTVRVVDEEGSGYTVKVTATSEQGALHKAIVKVRNSGARPEHARIIRQDVEEAIVASGPSHPLDDRAVRKLVWDTMKINADTGEQAIERALSVLAKKPQSRMVLDLQDKFQNLSDRLAQGVAEVATDYSKRRQRERDVDAGKPVTKQRPSKMTDYQKRRAQDKKDMELGEAKDLAKRVKIVAGSEAGKTGTIGEVRTGAFAGAPKTYTVDIDGGGSIQLPGKSLRLVRDTAVEAVEPTPTGLRHRAEPGVYGGAEPEEDPLRTLDKSGTNKIEKSLGIKFDREKKYQGGIDLGDGELDEVSKATLGRYVKLAGIDTADRSSSSSYKSGAAGDKYNKADPSRQEQNRERGIDRAVTRLTK